MAALLTSVRDDKDKTARLPAGMPADGDQGAAARRQRVRPRLHPARHRHPLRARRGPQRRGQRRRLDRRAPARTKGRFADFADFLRKVETVACNKKVVESLIKAGAFDSLGHPRRGPGADPRRGHRRVPCDIKRAEAAGQFSLFGGSRRRRRRPTPRRRSTIADPDGEWEKKLLLAYEREMLGLYVSDHPLLGVEHIIAAHADATDRRPGRATSTTARSSPSAASSPRHHPQGHQAGQPVGGRAAGGPRRRRRDAVLPADLRAGRAPARPRTRSCWSRGGSTSARTCRG